MPDVHVVPHGDGWALQDMDEILVDDGGRRLVFARREEALETGRRLAQEEEARLVLHEADGSVRADDVPSSGGDSATH